MVIAASNGQPERSSTDVIGVVGTANSAGGYSIIGSKFTSITKYPYNVAVLSKDNELFGGGFIYRNRWVITAAFTTELADEEDLRVRLGSESPFKGGQYFSLSKVIIHPNYTSTWDWNIALLKLKTKAKFGRKAKPIKITRIAPTTGNTGIVTGWGPQSKSANGIREYLNVDIYDRDTCNKKWYVSFPLNERSFCAYKSHAGKSDFGDPMVFEGNVVGLYLGGFGCAQDDFPGLYCDISKFYDWINDNIKKYKEVDNDTAGDDDIDDDEDE